MDGIRGTKIRTGGETVLFWFLDGQENHRNLENQELNAFSINIYFAYRLKFLELPLIDPLK